MKFVIRVLISVGALVILFRLVDVSALKHSILSIPLFTLLSVTIIYFCGQMLSSYKWWLLARTGGMEVSWFLAFKAYFLGMFVNCFGFGTVGGDFARAVVLGTGTKKHATSLASVFADRVHGLTILASIGVVSMAFFGRQHIGGEFLLLLPLCVGGVVLGWYFGPSLALSLVPEKTSLHRKLREVAGVFPRDWATLGYISLISFVFHLLQISLHQVMAAGFGASIPWYTLLVVIPIVNIVSTLPFSWNGLGVRENGYMFFLAPMVVSREQAIAFGVMWLFAMTVSSAIGGLVAVFSKEIDWPGKQLFAAKEPLVSKAKERILGAPVADYFTSPEARIEPDKRS